MLFWSLSVCHVESCSDHCSWAMADPIEKRQDENAINSAANAPSVSVSLPSSLPQEEDERRPTRLCPSENLCALQVMDVAIGFRRVTFPRQGPIVNQHGLRFGRLLNEPYGENLHPSDEHLALYLGRSEKSKPRGLPAMQKGHPPRTALSAHRSPSRRRGRGRSPRMTGPRPSSHN